MKVTKDEKIKLIAWTIILIGAHLYPVFKISYFKSWGMPQIIYALLLFLWSSSLNMRIVGKRTKRLFFQLALFMFILILVQMIKYNFCRKPIYCRYLWYAYYFPIISVPLTCFRIVCSIGEPEEGRNLKKSHLLWIPCILLVLFVLTNDLHEKVFYFKNGLDDYNNYGHNYGFYIILAWALVFILASFLQIIFKCPIKIKKTYFIYPFIPIVIYIIYLVIYNRYHFLFNDIPVKIHFQQAMLLTLILFWEACIKLGIIRTNKKHKDYLDNTGLDFTIIDNKGSIIFSDNDLDPDLFSFKSGEYINETSIIRKDDLRAGQIVWIEDVSDLVAAKKELEKLKAELKKEEDILRSENEVKEIQARNETKNYIYDKIYLSLSKERDEILNIIRKNDTDWDDIRFIALKGTYIKRWSNLKIIAEDLKNKGFDTVSIQELYYAIKESLNQLDFYGMKYEISGFEESFVISSDKLLKLYKDFEDRLEKILAENTLLKEKKDGSEENDLILVSLSKNGNDTTLKLKGVRNA